MEPGLFLPTIRLFPLSQSKPSSKCRVPRIWVSVPSSRYKPRGLATSRLGKAPPVLLVTEKPPARYCGELLLKKRKAPPTPEKELGLLIPHSSGKEAVRPLRHRSPYILMVTPFTEPMVPLLITLLNTDRLALLFT